MAQQPLYRNFARKYRPETFAEMIGQETITRTLANALKLGRIAHAYLFYGPRGCGKTTSARVLAKALNCTGNGNDKPTATPCGKCRQCLEIAQGADMDVLEMDAASHTQVEKIREVILDTVALSPARDRYKVFILDEVHMLSASSFNALLKTVEEPPSHVVFILATTERQKVPATILSRCQSFRFRPFTTEQIAGHLAGIAKEEKIDITQDALSIMARSAGGVMRDALTLLDRAVSFSPGRIETASVAEMLGLTPEELLKRTAAALLARDMQALHAAFAQLNAEGFDAQTLLRDLKTSFAGLFFCRMDNAAAEPFPGAREMAAAHSAAELANFSRRINKLADELRFSDTPALAAEIGLFTVMETAPDIDGFVRRLEAMEARLDGAAPSLPRASQPVAAAPTYAAPQPAPAPLPRPKPAPLQKPAASALPPLPKISLPPLSSVPAAKPETQTADATVQPVPSGTPDGAIWKKMLDSMERTHPMLHHYLASAHIEFTSHQEWKVLFANKFSLQSAEHNSAGISALLKSLAGRDIKLSFGEGAPKKDKPHFEEVASSPEQAQDDSGTVISEDEPLSEPAAVWQDIDTPPDPSEDPAVRKIVKLFHGKVIKQPGDEKH